MRSAEPIAGEPWPHDMMLTIDDRPNSLMELLWIREAYELRPPGEDLPPLLVEPPPVVRDGAVSADDRVGWEQAWARIWQAAAAHTGVEPGTGLFEELARTGDGSPERAALLGRLTGPRWRDDFGDGVFDDSFQVWSQEVAAASASTAPTQLAETPERRDLTAVIAAWRAGLTKIVTIPCRGEFTRKVTPNALLMTNRTRESSTTYRRALGAFLLPDGS